MSIEALITGCFSFNPLPHYLIFSINFIMMINYAKKNE
jgi:hypothetical protein